MTAFSSPALLASSARTYVAGSSADGLTVVGLDDLSENTADALAATPEVEFVQADLRDQAAVIAAARGCSTIYHQGAKRSVPRSMDEPALFTEVNVGGTLNVLLAAREAGAVVVSASSSSVYGDQSEFPLRESMTPRPRSPYAASKLATEIYCAGLWRSFGVPAVSLRYFNVYGPGQSPESEYAAVVPRFAVACMRESHRSSMAMASRHATSPTSTMSSTRTSAPRGRLNTPTGWPSTSAEGRSPRA